MQGWQNVGGVRRGNGAKRNDLAERNPSRHQAAYCYWLLNAVPLTIILTSSSTLLILFFTIITYTFDMNKNEKQSKFLDEVYTVAYHAQPKPTPNLIRIPIRPLYSPLNTIGILINGLIKNICVRPPILIPTDGAINNPKECIE